MYPIGWFQTTSVNGRMGESPERVHREGLVDGGQRQGAHSRGVPQGLGGVTCMYQPPGMA